MTRDTLDFRDFLLAAPDLSALALDRADEQARVVELDSQTAGRAHSRPE